jgi:hypothetical protein
MSYRVIKKEKVKKETPCSYQANVLITKGNQSKPQ